MNDDATRSARGLHPVPFFLLLAGGMLVLQLAIHAGPRFVDALRGGDVNLVPRRAAVVVAAAISLVLSALLTYFVNIRPRRRPRLTTTEELLPGEEVRHEGRATMLGSLGHLNGRVGSLWLTSTRLLFRSKGLDALMSLRGEVVRSWPLTEVERVEVRNVLIPVNHSVFVLRGTSWELPRLLVMRYHREPWIAALRAAGLEVIEA